jgi:hypothetical protein
VTQRYHRPLDARISAFLLVILYPHPDFCFAGFHSGFFMSRSFSFSPINSFSRYPRDMIEIKLSVQLALSYLIGEFLDHLTLKQHHKPRLIFIVGCVADNQIIARPD